MKQDLSKDQIVETLNKAKSIRREYFAEKEQIDKKLTQNYKIIEKLRDQLTEIELKELKTEQEKIEYFLIAGDDLGEAGPVRYKAREEFWHNFGLHRAGSFRETNQVALSVKLTYGSEKSLAQQLKALDKVLPYIKPQNDGMKKLPIFEHTLSEFGSYWLRVSEDRKQYIIESRYRDEKEFKSLADALKYIQKYHWYDGKDKEDDDY